MNLRISLRFLEIVHEHTETAPPLREYVTEIKNFTGCDAVRYPCAGRKL